MVSNKTLIFKQIPKGLPVAGQDIVLEDKGFDPEAAPPAGGITVEILYVSFDPYQRGRMRAKDIKSYTPPYDLGGPVTNDTVSRVLKSDSPDFKPGDILRGHLPTAEYAFISKEQLKGMKKIDNKYNLKDLALFIGPLGMPGLTAWSSLQDIGQPKKGETIFISSAAGAVGQIAGQVAKREGLRVIGSVGSDDKLDYIINELGFDGGFNYKKEKAADALKRLAPDGIDIYFENVGGEQLEAAINAMNWHGRIVCCGMISQYNTPAEERYPIRNLFEVVAKRLTIRGFIVGDDNMGPRYVESQQEQLGKWLAEGSVKAKLHITEGIDNAADGFIGMLQGKNFGKAVLKVKSE